jgi:predicted regulator of amino acid metabolism with ACT domain
MGTSKSNSGLRPNTPLLPDYAPAPEPDDPKKNEKDKQKNGEDQPLVGDWANAKAALTAATKAANKSIRKGRLGRAAKDYVSGSGGSAALRGSSIAGRAVGRNLGRLLFSVVAQGIESTLKQEGVEDLRGQSTEIVFAKLARQLSAKGGTVEETIANIAIVEALAYIYDEFDLAANHLVSLNSLTEEQAKEVIHVYITSYIFERWLHELGTKIENSALNELQVVQLEEEIRDFITESVKLRFDGIMPKAIDFNGDPGKKIIDEIFNQAYQMIESL